MSVLDLSLVKGPYGSGPNSPATIDGWSFRIDPNSVSLPIKAKVQKYRTVGGFAVQVYGTTWGDLTVTGQFGGLPHGGWPAQLQFLDRMVKIARDQAMQRSPTAVGQNFTPSQPFRFNFPLLQWDFLCYLKAYTSSDGPMAINMTNANINPKWTLTLFVVTDNGSLAKASETAYLQRLAPGLGLMWDSADSPEKYQGYTDDQYNSPITNTFLQPYINNPAGGSSNVVSSTPSNFTGPNSNSDPNGQYSSVGSTGKSVTPGNVNNIGKQNDFSVALLSELGVVTTDASSPLKVGSAKATNDVIMLNAQQAQEGMWTAYGPTSKYYAMNSHNPLNINASSFGYGYTPYNGTGGFPDWGNGVQGTAAVYRQKNFAGALQGLLDSNYREWANGLIAGGWATSSYGGDIYKSYTAYGGTDPYP